jgi:SAM-dependent methyltransferase
MTSDASIRTTARPQCALCGQLGESLHTGLEDRLFGILGKWRLARCSERQCGLIWMDPMPLAEDLGKAYHSYYTHDDRAAIGPESSLKRAYLAIKRSYLASRYGYRAGLKHGVSSSLGWLLYLLPIRRGGVDSEVRYLHARPGGRLLDIGCGSGAWLSDMRNLGWEVRGLDFDAEAVAVALRRGIEVDHGPLEAQRYPDESFEAITLNHVIEHLPDPFSTLAECRRILKPGGRLVVVTPNSASLGHRLFKEAWRGLEPPRHLHLFCPGSMRVSLEGAGFSHFEVRTVCSDYLLMHSLGLWARLAEPGRQLPLGLKAVSYLLTRLEAAMLAARPEVGECLVVQATKP